MEIEIFQQIIGYDAVFCQKCPIAQSADLEREASMSLRSRIAANPRVILACRVIGLGLFVAAFFLPACRDIALGIGSAGTLAGWQCARTALALVSEKDTFSSPFFLAFMSGWINPLVLIYLVAGFIPESSRLRRVVAVSILACIAATWIFFALIQFVPLIGHVLWIAGTLLILIPEVAGHEQKSVRNDQPETLNP